MRLFRKRTISWRRGGARRCWDRAAAARPAGGASDAFRLGLAVVIVAVSVPVMRANSAVELGILKPEERTGANRSAQATFLRSPTPLRGNPPAGACARATSGHGCLGPPGVGSVGVLDEHACRAWPGVLEACLAMASSDCS